jgi:hypothetical protein
MRKAVRALALVSVAMAVTAIRPVVAYPQVEMQACMQTGLVSVVQRGVKATVNDVKNYCHCFLSRALDQGRDINQSINYCNSRYILK